MWIMPCLIYSSIDLLMRPCGGFSSLGVVVRVSTLWRGVAVAAAAFGLAAVGTGSALAQPALAPVPAVTINAKSPLPVISHDVFVQYKNSARGADAVTITGSVSESTAGQVAALYAQPFPYSKPAAPVTGQTLTLPASSTPTAYSFTAEPTIATKYTVEVLPSSTASTPVVGQSPAKTVYVVTNQTGSSSKCGRPVCHLTLRIYTHLPKSAYGTESKKKWYFYFAIRLSSTRIPPFPRWTYLEPRARISKPRKINPTEFERTITWSFRVSNDAYAFSLNFCSKDSESKDGINLPGSHGCGAKKVRSNVRYLG